MLRARNSEFVRPGILLDKSAYNYLLNFLFNNAQGPKRQVNPPWLSLDKSAVIKGVNLNESLKKIGKNYLRGSQNKIWKKETRRYRWGWWHDRLLTLPPPSFTSPKGGLAPGSRGGGLKSCAKPYGFNACQDWCFWTGTPLAQMRTLLTL